MSKPEGTPPAVRDQGQSPRPAWAQHQPMQSVQMQGKLPPEVCVAAHPQNTERKNSTDTQQAGLSRLETAHLDRRAALDLLAGEVSHELANTLAFLRCSFDIAEQSALAAEDRTLAQKQIERLQRMLRNLRQLTLPPPARERVDGLVVLRRAGAELADVLVAKHITLAWIEPERLALHTDAPLFQLLARDLLAGVAGDAAEESSIVIQTTLPSGRDCGTIEVWRRTRDSAQPRASSPADPWAAMSSGEAALGLAVGRRIARTLGWELSPVIDAGRSGLRLLIPAAAFDVESAR